MQTDTHANTGRIHPEYNTLMPIARRRRKILLNSQTTRRAQFGRSSRSAKFKTHSKLQLNMV